jgi:hypothetical protein
MRSNIALQRAIDIDAGIDAIIHANQQPRLSRDSIKDRNDLVILTQLLAIELRVGERVDARRIAVRGEEPPVGVGAVVGEARDGRQTRGSGDGAVVVGQNRGQRCHERIERITIQVQEGTLVPDRIAKRIHLDGVENAVVIPRRRAGGKDEPRAGSAVGVELDLPAVVIAVVVPDQGIGILQRGHIDAQHLVAANIDDARIAGIDRQSQGAEALGLEEVVSRLRLIVRGNPISGRGRVGDDIKRRGNLAEGLRALASYEITELVLAFHERLCADSILLDQKASIVMTQ